MTDAVKEDHDRATAKVARLDPDDRQLLSWLVRGDYDRAIAGRLNVSSRTVKRRVAQLLDELGVERRIQAAYLAGEARLLDGHRGG